MKSVHAHAFPPVHVKVLQGTTHGLSGGNQYFLAYPTLRPLDAIPGMKRLTLPVLSARDIYVNGFQAPPTDKTGDAWRCMENQSGGKEGCVVYLSPGEDKITNIMLFKNNLSVIVSQLKG